MSLRLGTHVNVHEPLDTEHYNGDTRELDETRETV